MAELLGQTEPPPGATIATHDGCLRDRRSGRIRPPPGPRRFLGALVRTLQTTHPHSRKGGAGGAGQSEARNDEYRRAPQIAGQLGIRSIPGRHCVSARPAGRRFHGRIAGEPGSRLHRAPCRAIAEEEDLHAMADAALAAGEPLAALEIFRELYEKDSGDLAALAGLIKTNVATGELEDAKKLLAQVPETAAHDPAVAAARAAVENATQAAGLGEIGELERRVAAEPNDPQARFDLAIALNAQSRRGEAADALLAIIKRDRDWNDAAARKQLLQFFEAWGNMDAATVAARRKLSTLLFS